MLNIEKPLKEITLKFKVTESTKNELDTFIKYVQSTQPHATPDRVIEAMLNKVIPKAGSQAKKYKEFKKGE